MHPETTPLIHRFQNPRAAAHDNSLTLRTGSLRDYNQLSQHHYKSNRPATATRVLVLQHNRPTVVGRFLHRPSQPTVVAVLVESLPSLSCRTRNAALADRYRSHRSPWQHARLLNHELRCISRVVVLPQFRGLGLAVQLVQHALAHPQTIFTEALAAMGHVHPFFQRAGMTPYHRHPHPHDARLTTALQSAGFHPSDLALLHQTWNRIQQLPTPQHDFLLAELHRWHRATRARNHRAPDPQTTNPLHHLTTAQHRLLCQPIYYLHDNCKPSTRLS